VRPSVEPWVAVALPLPAEDSSRLSCSTAHRTPEPLLQRQRPGPSTIHTPTPLAPANQPAALDRLALPHTLGPPYSPYKPKPPPTLTLSRSSFNSQSKANTRPILLAHTGSRCPAILAGAVTVQGVLAPLLSSSPLSSGISSIIGVGFSRFGVKGIYHGCSVHILDSIFILLFYRLRLDFSTQQSIGLLTI